MIILGLNYIAIANFLIFICLLFFKKLRNRTNKVLSFLFTNIILTLVLNLFMYNKILVDYPIVLYVAYLVEFLWAPSLYFYINLLLGQENSFSIKKLWHFTNFIIVIIFYIWLFFQSYQYRYNLVLDMQENIIPWQYLVFNYLSVFQFLFFMIVSNYRVIRYNQMQISQDEKPDFLWLEKILKTVFVLCVLMYIPITISSSLLLYVILVPVASIILFIYLMLNAITSPVLLSDNVILNYDTGNNISNKDVKSENISQLVNNKQSRVDSLTVNLDDILHKYFVDKKLYLKKDINIQYVAEICDMHVKTISLFINETYNKNFTEYVNNYRILEAKQLLKDSKYQKYSFDVIADTVGFTSRSTFYNAFKKFNNTTPKQYVDSLRMA